MATVSIITVCFNSETTISRTIESVLNQTIEKLEYIIIDGASKDKTVEIAKSYEKAFAEKGYDYRIYSEPDKGIYDAMNKGIKKATGELIGIINSSDWYEPSAVKTAVSYYGATRYDLFYADLQIWDEDKEGNLSKKLVKKARIRDLVVSRDWNHPTTFVPKHVYEALNYFKLESIHDDWDLILRIRKNNPRMVIANEVLANFTMGGVSNEKSIKKCISRGKARYRIYRNNGYSRFYWFECVLIEAVKYIL